MYGFPLHSVTVSDETLHKTQAEENDSAALPCPLPPPTFPRGNAPGVSFASPSRDTSKSLARAHLPSWFRAIVLFACLRRMLLPLVIAQIVGPRFWSLPLALPLSRPAYARWLGGKKCSPPLIPLPSDIEYTMALYRVDPRLSRSLAFTTR